MTHTASQFYLLTRRYFGPFFVTQAFGAFTDNLFKTAIAVMIAYGMINTGSISAPILVSLATASFIFPFILFSPIAGQIADQSDKSRIIRILKMAEIGIAILAIIAMTLNSVALSFIALISLGVQSAFFAPCKFSILPQHLQKNELLAGNALTSTGTYLSILLGTISGTLLVTMENSVLFLSCAMIMSAGIGLIASFKIPPAPAQAEKTALSLNIFKHSMQNIAFAFSKSPPAVRVSLLGITWFYGVAATLHTQFPNFAKTTLNVDTNTLAFFLVLFSLGIGIGGLTITHILKGKISLRSVTGSAALIALFCGDLFLASKTLLAMDTAATLTLPEFLDSGLGIRLSFDLFALSFAGGLYVVPLRAMMQHECADNIRARVLSAGILLDSCAILISALFATAVFAIGFAVEDLFLIMSVLTWGVAISFWRFARGAKAGTS
jgi:acyl-[acyl-carrier-protein]-phospholipid O-acyltransferase/long-chain-fatty-acid--[acyl-carrier-protein] ligase